MTGAAFLAGMYHNAQEHGIEMVRCEIMHHLQALLGNAFFHHNQRQFYTFLVISTAFVLEHHSRNER